MAMSTLKAFIANRNLNEGGYHTYPSQSLADRRKAAATHKASQLQDVHNKLDEHRRSVLHHLEGIKKMVTSDTYKSDDNASWGHVGSMEAILKHLKETHGYHEHAFGSSDDSGRDPRDPARNNGRDPRQPVRYQPPKQHSNKTDPTSYESTYAHRDIRARRSDEADPTSYE